MTTLRVRHLFPNSNRSWLWPLAVAALIFIASSRPHIPGPAVPSIDKMAHFAVFGLLATAIVRLGTGWRAVLMAVVLASGYGVFDEWHQSFTPGRTVEVGDWVADTMGAIVAATLYGAWPRYRAFLEMPLRRKRRVENPAGVASVSNS